MDLLTQQVRAMCMCWSADANKPHVDMLQRKHSVGTHGYDYPPGLCMPAFINENTASVLTTSTDV